MIDSDDPPTNSSETEAEALDRVLRSGPGGAFLLAGIATTIVVALWLAFYLFVFLPHASP
ncbi:hypothetical protein LGH82_04585 [Mesorhizobium sp. PAMC28654]|nr:hypothetical protein LGH82_04585 [Mesorhizobium sp. PAMC28654]